MKKEECSDEGMKMAEWMEVGRQRANVHDRPPFLYGPVYLQYLSDRSFFEKTFLG